MFCGVFRTLSLRSDNIFLLALLHQPLLNDIVLMKDVAQKMSIIELRDQTFSISGGKVSNHCFHYGAGRYPVPKYLPLDRRGPRDSALPHLPPQNGVEKPFTFISRAGNKVTFRSGKRRVDVVALR